MRSRLVTRCGRILPSAAQPAHQLVSAAWICVAGTSTTPSAIPTTDGVASTIRIPVWINHHCGTEQISQLDTDCMNHGVPHIYTPPERAGRVTTMRLLR